MKVIIIEEGAPKQINNKTRTTGMFGENSNSIITDTDTVKSKNC